MHLSALLWHPPLRPTWEHSPVQMSEGETRIRGILVPAQLVQLVQTERWKHPGEAALARVAPWFADPLDFLADTRRHGTAITFPRPAGRRRGVSSSLSPHPVAAPRHGRTALARRRQRRPHRH